MLQQLKIIGLMLKYLAIAALILAAAAAVLYLTYYLTRQGTQADHNIFIKSAPGVQMEVTRELR